MSHFTVLIDLGTIGPSAVTMTIAEMMEPFQESGVLSEAECAASKYHTLKYDEEYKYSYYWNDNSFWDWYQIGGRWRGFFMVPKISKITGVENFAWSGEGGVFDNDPKAVPPAYVSSHVPADVCYKGDIDDAVMRAADVHRYGMYYDELRSEINAGQKPFLHFMGEEQKTALMRSDRAEFIRIALGEDSWHPYATLIDGKYEGSTMGWFGMTTDEVNDWPTKFRELYDNIPDDHIVALLDCHV